MLLVTKVIDSAAIAANARRGARPPEDLLAKPGTGYWYDVNPMNTTTRSYDAHAFHDSLPNGRCSGQLSINMMEVRFSSRHGHCALPLGGLQLRLGGASDRLVYFSHPSKTDWTCYTADRTVLKDPQLNADPMLQALTAKMTRKRVYNWAVLAVVGAFILMLPVAVFVSMDSISAVIARRIPPEWEQQLGQQAYQQYAIQNQMLEAEHANVQLQLLLQPVLQAIAGDRYDFQVMISADSSLNAFALPGGFIVLHSGLVLKADSAEELLGVIAHELSHVTKQHGMRNIIAASSTFLIIQAVIGDVNGLMATLAMAIPMLLNQSYSRGFETEADDAGLGLLQRAHINPRGMSDFFEKILAREREMLANIEDDDTRMMLETGMGFLSSHPATEDRIASISNQIKLLPGQEYKNLDSVFEKLQTAVKQFVTETEEDVKDDEIND